MKIMKQNTKYTVFHVKVTAISEKITDNTFKICS